MEIEKIKSRFGATRILIFLIAMGANNSFYVKSIATYASTFFGYIILVLAIVSM